MRWLAQTHSADRKFCASARSLALESATTIAVSSAKNMGMSNYSRGTDWDTSDKDITCSKTTLKVVADPIAIWENESFFGLGRFPESLLGWSRTCRDGILPRNFVSWSTWNWAGHSSWDDPGSDGSRTVSGPEEAVVGMALLREKFHSGGVYCSTAEIPRVGCSVMIVRIGTFGLMARWSWEPAQTLQRWGPRQFFAWLPQR